MIVQVITHGGHGDPQTDALYLAAELALKAFSSLGEVVARDEAEQALLAHAQVSLSQTHRAAMDVLKGRSSHAHR